jgi:hypothetical protein
VTRRSLTAEERRYLRREVDRRKRVLLALRPGVDLRFARRNREPLLEDFTLAGTTRSVPCDDPKCGTVLGPVVQMCADCAKQFEIEITKTAGTKTITSTESEEPGQLILFDDEGAA